MILQILLLCVGFVLLVKGADFFVDGAAGIAGKLGIPQLIVGLTIVAMGTSLPEAAVSITSALKGSAGITIGNVVGSNIMNVLVILGITAVITNVAIQKSTLYCEIPFMIGITALMIVFGITERFIGLTIVAFGTSLPELVTSVTAAKSGNAGIAIGNIVGSNIFNILFVIGTTALICNVPFESKFLIDSAVAVAAGVILWLGTIRHKELRRPCGVVMLVAYVGYFAYLCMN